jgi:iron(III) transport system permease protein
MLALVLYPYVYLLARAAFLEQSAAMLEVSRSLGAGPWRRFLTVSLPMARPALIAGVSLVQMEALADYGAVQYFGVSTFTTGLFRVWFGMNDSTAAAQLAGCCCCSSLPCWCLNGCRGGKPGFITPAAQSAAGAAALARSVAMAGGRGLPDPAAGRISDSSGTVGGLGLADRARNGGSAVSAPGGQQSAAGGGNGAADSAAGGAAGLRPALRPHPLVRLAVRSAGLGYAVPGTVIAIGVMLPLAAIDRTWTAGRGRGSAAPPACC